MASIRIPVSEFRERIQKMRKALEKRGMDALLIYGDEYRK